MVHDWFDHGTPAKRNKIKIPLKSDDPLRKKMKGKFVFSLWCPFVRRLLFDMMYGKKANEAQ